MLAPSPVAAIYQVLQQVQAKAEANAGIFQKNEAATRAALIDPVLRALGWDTSNVRMVEPEKTVSNELRIDYLLNDPTGKPWVVIEAKCLGSSLDKYGYVGKILGYAISLNVHTVCITDGLAWHLHTHLQNGKPEPIVFTLAKNDFLSAANELLRWLDAAQCGHGILPVAEEAIAAPATQTLLTKPVSKQLSKPKQQANQQMQSETAFTNAAQIHQLNLSPGQKPKQLRLPNGTIKPISTWKDILLEVCYLVLATNAHLAMPFPDKAGKKRFLLSN
ncbi:hypothetical protein [Hymenobacter sp. B1770]|uniref:hypothetical protein n=1 Tax=Hymenobacter sp. B1770 TaxID=1718788 RepID=UPI003CEC4213